MTQKNRNIFQKSTQSAPALPPAPPPIPESQPTVLQKSEADSLSLPLFDATPAPAIALDTEFRITHANRMAATFFGEPAEQLVGRRCFELLRSGICDTDRCAVAKAVQAGAFHQEETVAALAKGETLVRCTGDVLRDASGEIVGGVEVFWELQQAQSMDKHLRAAAHRIGDG